MKFIESVPRRYYSVATMEIQSRRLHDAAARGAIDVCLDARNAGGAVTFVPQDAKVRYI